MKLVNEKTEIHNSRDVIFMENNIQDRVYLLILPKYRYSFKYCHLKIYIAIVEFYSIENRDFVICVLGTIYVLACVCCDVRGLEDVDQCLNNSDARNQAAIEEGNHCLLLFT